VAKAGEAAEVAAKAEGGFWGRLVSPAAFKYLGAASAAVDVIVNVKEALGAKTEGENELALSHGVAAVGAFSIAVGSAVAGGSYATEAALLTMMSCGLLWGGTLVLAVGYLLVNHFSRSPFQKLVRYCTFGVESGHRGTASWLEGNFAQWNDTPASVASQVRHLMALLCDFKVFGSGYDTHIIHAEFGWLPPNAEAEVEFQIEYDGGQIFRPRYVIDFEEKSVTPKEKSDAPSTWAIAGERSIRVTLGACRPERFFQRTIIRSKCEIGIVYGEKKKGERPSIPTRGSISYVIFDPERKARSRELRSVEFDFAEQKKSGE